MEAANQIYSLRSVIHRHGEYQQSGHYTIDIHNSAVASVNTYDDHLWSTKASNPLHSAHHIGSSSATIIIYEQQYTTSQLNQLTDQFDNNCCESVNMTQFLQDESVLHISTDSELDIIHDFKCDNAGLTEESNRHLPPLWCPRCHAATRNVSVPPASKCVFVHPMRKAGSEVFGISSRTHKQLTMLLTASSLLFTDVSISKRTACK
jgi:hypothetical protein